jgi:hypothetical protein
MRNLENYIVHCPVENIQWDEHDRPYEQTPNGKIMLSIKSGTLQTKIKTRNV